MLPLKDDVPAVRVRFPYVNLGLIAANVLIFIYEISLSRIQLEQFIFRYGAIPVFIINGERLPALFSSMFLHGGFDHIIGNMLYLWIFGDNVEDACGHLGFLVMYLLAGLSGAFLHILTAMNSRTPMIGASGAISGVLGAYLVLFPTARILALIPFGFFIRLVYLPAYLFLGLWILLQFIYGFASLPGIGGGIAFFAHIGGFLFGLIWGLILRPRRNKGRTLYF